MQQFFKSLCVIAILALQCAVPYLLFTAGADDPVDLQVSKMRQVMIGLHDLTAQEHGQLPSPVHYSHDGKPLLSWRVMILPYMGYGKLFSKFRFREPWDSKHNKLLLKKMPSEYSSSRGRDRESCTTRFKLFVGKGCVFYPHPKSGRFVGEHLITINGRDGIYNVLALAETDPPVEWTKPDDIAIDLQKPLQKLRGPLEGGFLAANAAAEIYWIKDSITDHDLRSIISTRDGKPQRLVHINETKLLWDGR